MKKALIYGLSLALVFSLSACTPTQEDAPEDTSTPEVTEPADTSTPEQTAPAEPDDQEPQETAETTADTEPTETPAPETPEVETPVEAEPTYSFTSVNETVYATTTVNIREGFSADTDKVGSLGRGQSVKRVGIGTGDAEGWSQVEFNGQTAYISSDYLSLTKPAAQSSGNNSGSGGQTSQSKPSTGTSSGQQSSGSSGGQTQTQQPSQPSSGQNQSSSSDDDSWKDQYTGGITVIDPDNYNGTNWMEEGTGGSAAGNEWNGEFHDKDEMWEGIQ